jgi:lysophospholipase L1-like esterase
MFRVHRSTSSALATPPTGTQVFTSVGSTSFTVPSGVYSICAVAVGGGGGGIASNGFPKQRSVKLVLSILAAILISSCGGGSAVHTVVSLGDSITLRTGQCSVTDTVQTCTSAGRDFPQNSYATYVPQVISNQGRGGDTCTPQAPFGPGPFNGVQRGVLLRVQEAISVHPSQISVLIGANDLNSWNVSEADVLSCIVQVWTAIQAAGIEPIALTYETMPLMNGIAELNSNIRAEASKRGIRVVDFETIPGIVTVDGIHPDVPSAQAMGNLWNVTIHD